MKHHSSRTLRTLALVTMAFPVTYLVTGAVLFDIPISAALRLLLSPAFALLCIAAMTTGYGLWEMRRWAWYSLVPVSVWAIYFNAILALDFSESHHRGLAFSLSVALVLSFLARVTRELRVPYFLPRIRWWESNPRLKLMVPSQLTELHGDSPLIRPCEIWDLAASGCFIKWRHETALNEIVRVSFDLFGRSVEAKGVVVWRTPGGVTHPRGIGVKFQELDRAQKRTLKAMEKRLREISRLYSTSRFLMGAQEFSSRMEDLRKRPLAQKETA